MTGLFDADLRQAAALSKRLRPPVPVLPLARLIRRNQLLIEAASPRAVETLLPKVIARKKALLLLSVGGLLRNPALLRRAVARKIRLYVPSGALAGLDGIKAAAIGRLRSVTLTTRKHPRALAGAPGLKRRGIRLYGLRRAKTIFEGSAAQAAAGFPQNINVAATLALAGLGGRRTHVRIVADPAARVNTHEVEAVGSFGRLFVRTENRPAPGNPKTSQLAIQSALAALNRILQPVQIGS